jgi:membrane-associated protease RseP (regulator of RpoE activity)
MPKAIQIPNPIKLKNLTYFLRIGGTDVSAHWSVLAVVAFILIGVLRRPVMSLIGLSAYLGVLMIHECGHMIVARRLGCTVSDIELYPVFAITRFSTPWSRFDHCLIAWGGVMAQAIVALPLVLFVAAFGYTRFEAINEIFAILGFFSLGVAVFNLLPIKPLDGSIAWEVVPEFIRRKKAERSTKRR